MTATMTVGPASGVLKDAAPETWKPKEVALTVLIDRWITHFFFACRDLFAGMQ